MSKKVVLSLFLSASFVSCKDIRLGWDLERGSSDNADSDFQTRWLQIASLLPLLS